MSTDSPTSPVPASNPLDVIERHVAAGCSVHQGRVGTREATIIITPYCHERMTQRDLDDSDVLQILEQPPSSHGAGKTAGRREVWGNIDRRKIRLVYEQLDREIFKVITAYQE